MDMVRMSEIYNYYSEELDRAVDNVQVIDVLDNMEVVLSEMAELISKGEGTVQGLFKAADAYRLVAAGCQRKAELYETQAKACIDTAAEMLEAADEIPENPGWVRVGDGYWVREGSAEEDEAFEELEEREQVRDECNHDCAHCKNKLRAEWHEGPDGKLRMSWEEWHGINEDFDPRDTKNLHDWE